MGIWIASEGKYGSRHAEKSIHVGEKEARREKEKKWNLK